MSSTPIIKRDAQNAVTDITIALSQPLLCTPHYKFQSATHYIKHLILEPTGYSYYNHRMWPWSASENFWIHNISRTGVKVQIRLISLHGNIK